MHLQCMIQERNYLNFTCFSNLDRNKQIICCTSSDFNSEHQDLIKPFDVHSRLTKGEVYFDSSRYRYSENGTPFSVIFFLVILYSTYDMFKEFIYNRGKLRFVSCMHRVISHFSFQVKRQ